MRTTRPPKNPTKKWAWILYQLALRGLTFSDIARDLGVTRNAVYRTRHEPRPRMQLAIADRLGIPPCRIWPERYPECLMGCLHDSEQKCAAQ